MIDNNVITVIYHIFESSEEAQLLYVLLTEYYVLACSKVTDNLFSVLLPAPLPIDRNVTHIRMSITTVRAADVLTFPPQKVNNKSDPVYRGLTNAVGQQHTMLLPCRVFYIPQSFSACFAAALSKQRLK